MADIAGELRRIAIEIALNAESRSLQLKREYAEAEPELAAKKTALNDLINASNRLISFVPQYDGVYQCPFCWTEDGACSPLTPDGVVGAEETSADRFHCALKGHLFSFEA